MRQFFITPLICAVRLGVNECAPKVDAKLVNYVSACQPSTAVNPQCLVLAAGNTTSAENDNQLVSLVAENFDTTIASLPTNVRNRISNGLTSKSIQLTRPVFDPETGHVTQVPATLADFDTVRDFLTALGRFFDPNFVLENFWIAD